MFEVDKQRMLLELCVSNKELAAITIGLLKPSYFDPTLKKGVKFICDYFATHRDVPKLEVVRAETGLLLENAGGLSRADIKYASGEIENFCRTQAVIEVAQSTPELIVKGEYGLMIDRFKKAIAIGLAKDLGMNYFENIETRLSETLELDQRISTGIPELDAIMGGGLAREELITIVANSGGGKSMTMLNLCHNLLAQGYNGVYITLEMSQKVVSKRLDSMISKVAQQNLLRDVDVVAMKLNEAASTYGQFRIKRLPESRTNITHIQSWLQQLEQETGFYPDFICGDYLDIMGTTQNISVENLFVKDKYVTEEFRSLGFDYNAMMISASQLGRGAIEAEKIHQGHIQGGISKINTSDWTVAVKQDDLMRASGQLDMTLIKARNSEHSGKTIHLGWDPVSLRIGSLKSEKDKLTLVKKPPALGLSGTQFGGNKTVLNLLQ